MMACCKTKLQRVSGLRSSEERMESLNEFNGCMFCILSILSGHMYKSRDYAVYNYSVY